MADPPAHFPRGFFERVDESDDALFYREPRFVTHIDDASIRALTAAYRELLVPGSDVLDLMSSWVSHLPEGVGFGRVRMAEEMRRRTCRTARSRGSGRPAIPGRW